MRKGIHIRFILMGLLISLLVVGSRVSAQEKMSDSSYVKIYPGENGETLWTNGRFDDYAYDQLEYNKKAFVGSLEIKYEGGYSKGKRSGKGTSYSYGLYTGNYVMRYQGQWKND